MRHIDYAPKGHLRAPIARQLLICKPLCQVLVVLGVATAIGLAVVAAVFMYTS